ncbi:methyltransferase domain-containing protein [Calothrix sp. NIES-3974]|uniref:methyltransferase domain-containing protein n=1 Tax=Calothrix sp. NIES-3974 TaxID=2005462 RepID=UPI000B61C1AC|nr:methyltransferase domain-containing protein [Calothrix sp. NIES-3974]BAZ07974.1 type II restriction enzyme NspV homolog [Calothrix sp. NIES-3974]
MVKSLHKRQFGDFQTPDILATEVTQVLQVNHKISPEVVIEPSCGKGAFIRAVLDSFPDSRIIGLDINKKYLEEAKLSISNHPLSHHVTLDESDFFKINWEAILSTISGYILVIGNPPWVTNSDLSILDSQNLPPKSNFQNQRGIAAITGSGNFDISEWMLLQYVEWLSKRMGTIAVLCKYSVARKVMYQVKNKFGSRFSFHIYLIDAKLYFQASVEACLCVISTDYPDNCDCKVYQNLKSREVSYLIGERDGLIIRDTKKYEEWRHLLGHNFQYIWRSGIKHDCSKVMELERIHDNLFMNGLQEKYCLEMDYLYPLLKSSDIGKGATENCRKFVLVTQKSVGEDTSIIENVAPKTWQYLLEHDEYFKHRKSIIYKNKPAYSIFGIGSYSFKKWKIAISGLYKQLKFCLVKPLHGKSVMLDDTVNFLSFDTEEEAKFIFQLLTSTPAMEFLDSMIFWDEKRPITIDILKRLSLQAVAKELGFLKTYFYWTKTVQIPVDLQKQKVTLAKLKN